MDVPPHVKLHIQNQLWESTTSPTYLSRNDDNNHQTESTNNNNSLSTTPQPCLESPKLDDDVNMTDPEFFPNGIEIKVVHDRTDAYDTDSQWINQLKPDDTCFVCLDIVKQQNFSILRLPCGHTMHSKCLQQMGAAGIHAIKDPAKGELPSFVTKCVCQKQILGDFHPQFDAACAEYRKFRSLSLVERTNVWSKTLPLVIFALENVVKSIWRDWRQYKVENRLTNTILGSATGIMACTHTAISQFLHVPFPSMQMALYNLMVAFDANGTSTTWGVSGVEWVLTVVKGANNVGNTSVRRFVLPFMIAYLAKLMDLTVDRPEMVDDDGLVWYDPSGEVDVLLRGQVQALMLQMLQECVADDEAIRQYLQNYVVTILINSGNVWMCEELVKRHGTKAFVLKPLLKVLEEDCRKDKKFYARHDQFEVLLEMHSGWEAEENISGAVGE